MRKHPQDYIDYADERRIIITSTDDIGGDVRRAFVVTVPGDVVTNPQDIIKLLLEPVYGTDGYSISDTRTITECGASGAIHEVILSIVGGITEGITTHVLERVQSWMEYADRQDISLPGYDENCQISQTQDILRRQFRAHGELTVLDRQDTANELNLVIRDSSDVRWDCKLDRVTGAISISLRPR